MRTPRRLLMLAVVLALPLAMMATASAAPKGDRFCQDNPDHHRCGGDPQGLVEVSIEANLTKAHETGDTIHYTFVVTNGLDDEEVTVTDTLETLNEIVLAGVSDFESSYVLDDSDMETETLTNTVIATASSETRQATATVEVDEYELCDDPDGDGVFSTDASVCIWKPAPGDWKISVVPDSTRPTRVMITVRDHVPGNWCPQGITERWRPDGDPVVTTVSIPEWDPGTWAGGQVCSIGGAAGAFYDVGTPDSFYLDTTGNVIVTPQE